MRSVNAQRIIMIIQIILLTLFASGARVISAQVLQAPDAGAVRQVFVSTTSEVASYTAPSGAFEPIPSASLIADLEADSTLLITFSARGAVQPSGSQVVPFVFVKCEIDGAPCQPEMNQVEFLYPQFCCDTRSFTWVVGAASKGTHSITILWGMGNPTSAGMSSRTLVVFGVRPHQSPSTGRTTPETRTKGR